MPKLPLHWNILIGMFLGAAAGWLATRFEAGPQLIRDWLAPLGQIFINLLKVIAVPLVIVSLAKGIADLKGLAALSKVGGRTIFWFLVTSVGSVILGLVLVNSFAPGAVVSADTLADLTGDLAPAMNERLQASGATAPKRPLDFFVNLVPQNIFHAAGDNGNMLQVIFFTAFFSVCLLLLPPERQKPVVELLDVLNEVLLKMIHLIMRAAPLAVLALIASLVVDLQNGELFAALFGYALTMILGMILILLAYLVLIRLFTALRPGFFLRGLLPAQLVAFSTSSSMATLPVTMEAAEEGLGVENEIASFVCPVGATINMDASSLMQAVAPVFLCQVFGHELALGDQLIIVLTATLAAIGAAGAPSAGIVMLVIVLESVGFPAEHLPLALAMILAVDRPLDMGRTVVNISGDITVSVLVAHSLGRLKAPDDRG